MDSQQHAERWQHAEALLLQLSNNHVAQGITRELCDILRDLRRHQMELEVQNSQLRIRNQESENERQRIAHGLYDAVNQSLFSAHLISETLLVPSMIIAYDERANLRHLDASIKRAIAEMRILLLELKPERLLDTPLETLLRQLLYIFDETDITIECDVTGQTPDEVKIAIYRLAQAALTNIYQRVKSGEIYIQLRQNSIEIRFHNRDYENEVDFNADSIRLDSGLDDIRSSVAASGGQLHIASHPTIGTQIMAEW